MSLPKVSDAVPEVLTSPTNPHVVTNGSVSGSKENEPIKLRKGNLFDSDVIGRIAAKTYCETPLTKFLSPNRHKYYDHYERGFRQRARTRMFSPRNMTIVACNGSGEVVGYAQFERLGNDYGAKQQIMSHSIVRRILFWALSWVWAFWCNLVIFLDPDKSEDPAAVKMFASWHQDGDKHFKPYPERQDRWYAQSVVIDAAYQKRGIGTRLMKEVIEKAERENVPIGLEASMEGERLYRGVGFDLLGRFEHQKEETDNPIFPPGYWNGGGVMMWTPSAWRQQNGESVKI
jgi:ribosomal protein S18 acetylase RimI-like enzyme